MRREVICLLTLVVMTLAGGGAAAASPEGNEDVPAVAAGEPADKVPMAGTAEKSVAEMVREDGTNGIVLEEKEDPVESRRKFTLEEKLVLDQELIRQDEPLKAIEDLTAIIEERGCLVPARAYYLRSVAYFNMQKYNDALVDAQTASRMDVDEPLYYVQKGLVRLAISQMYDIMGQDDEVKEQCVMVETDSEKSLEFQHRYWPALFCRAISNYMRGSVHKSLEDCGDALKSGARGISYVEAFHIYVQAERSAGNPKFPGVDIQPVLFKSINGLMDYIDKTPVLRDTGV